MRLEELNLVEGDPVLIIRGERDTILLYQFWAMRDGCAFGKKGVELKKPMKIGGIELPYLIPLPNQDDDLIPIPLSASKIYHGPDEIITALEMHKGYGLYAEIIKIWRDRPTKKLIH